MTNNDDSALQTYLTHLRDAGAAIVVTGDTQLAVRAAASRRLFGQADRPYSRILVCPSRQSHADEYLPSESTTDGATRVIATETPRLSASADGPLYRGAPSRDTPTDDRAISSSVHPQARLQQSEPLSGLERAVLTAIDEVCTVDSQCSQLRVGITSIVPVLESVGRDTAVVFCRSIIDATRSEGGIAHLHVPFAEGDVQYGLVGESTDIRVELRPSPGDLPGAGPAWRWHPPAYVQPTPTEWVPL